ncbi:MAG: hypothetical protein HYT94_02250 [Parcubacteria group bacterium]|nr:hypothetical protein [Parcubacteria group bacterium]
MERSSFASKDFARGWQIIAGYLTRYRKDMIFLSGLGLVSALANGFTPFLFFRAPTFFHNFIIPQVFGFICGSGLYGLLCSPYGLRCRCPPT